MQAITQEKVMDRMQRGMDLSREGGAVLLDSGEWVVPSSARNGRGYTVNLEEGTCDCSDFRYRCSKHQGVSCKHIVSARVAAECMAAAAPARA